MPQSHTQLYAHLIFSTKERQPILDVEIRPRVHAYLASLVRDLGSPFVVVGGVADPVHISFQEEYREFLKRYEIDFDERYMWD